MQMPSRSSFFTKNKCFKISLFCSFNIINTGNGVLYTQIHVGLEVNIAHSYFGVSEIKNNLNSVLRLFIKHPQKLTNQKLFYCGLYYVFRSFPVHSPFIPRSFPVHSPFIPRSFPVHSPFIPVHSPFIP